MAVGYVLATYTAQDVLTLGKHADGAQRTQLYRADESQRLCGYGDDTNLSGSLGHMDQ